MRHFLWHLLHPRQSCMPEVNEMDEISDVSLCRQMLYDAFQQPEKIAQMLDLPAISEEVEEMEHRAHHTRMEAMAPIMPLLLGQAEFFGRASALMQVQQFGVTEDLDPEAAVDAATVIFTSIIRASLVSAISSAVDLGVLDILKEVFTDE